MFIECLLGRTVFAGWGFRLFLRSPQTERPASDMQNPLTFTAALISSCAPWNNVALSDASQPITISARP